MTRLEGGCERRVLPPAPRLLLHAVSGMCDGGAMDVGVEDIDAIPVGNLRVSRADFATLWRAAELLGKSDSYAAGVAITCRWIACATVVFNGRPGPSYAPITRTRQRAHEELLEREYLAAEKQCIWVAGTESRRPIIEGAAATLRWAWKGRGQPPLKRLAEAS